MVAIKYSLCTKQGKRKAISIIRTVYPSVSIREIINGLYFAYSDCQTVGFKLAENIIRNVKLTEKVL